MGKKNKNRFKKHLKASEGESASEVKMSEPDEEVEVAGEDEEEAKASSENGEAEEAKVSEPPENPPHNMKFPDKGVRYQFMAMQQKLKSIKDGLAQPILNDLNKLYEVRLDKACQASPDYLKIKSARDEALDELEKLVAKQEDIPKDYVIMQMNADEDHITMLHAPALVGKRLAERVN